MRARVQRRVVTRIRGAAGDLYAALEKYRQRRVHMASGGSLSAVVRRALGSP